ncbi:MAG: SCO1664 family protein [Actinomycetes bacterium]
MSASIDLAHVLATADLRINGQLAGASNATLAATIDSGQDQISCVYKPRRGERPLWDFPSGTLAHREVATYQLDQALGWGLVPVTVWREDGPYGPGMCQVWIQDEVNHPACDVVVPDNVPAGWHVVLEAETYDGTPVVVAHDSDPRAQQMAIFDVLANNADRKGGHILRDDSGTLFGIDHGLTFHVEPKLRTVLWGWSGQIIPDSLIADLQRLSESMSVSGSAGAQLRMHLSDAEIDALCQRLDNLMSTGVFPLPGTDYPPLPWPPM